MRQDKPDGPRVPPRRFSDLRVGTFQAAEWAFVALGGRALYRRLFLAPGRFGMREEVLPVPAQRAGTAPLTIAQLSDLHAGPFLARGDLAAVVDAVSEARPDLVFLTGDFITRHWREALLVLDELARLEAPAGVFAVFGNHDYRGREEGRIAAAYAERGIRFLRNESVRVDHAGWRLAVVGLEDLEEGRVVDLEGARAGLGDELELVLCHNPMGAPALARPQCRVVFAGHTHGTQIDLPWLRTLGPQHPGLRIELGATTLLVSRGLGVVGAPLRFRAPAEVVLARLVSDEQAPAPRPVGPGRAEGGA